MRGEMKGGAAPIHCAIDITASPPQRSGRYREVRLYPSVVAAGLESESAGGWHRQLNIAIVGVDAARSRQ